MKADIAGLLQPFAECDDVAGVCGALADGIAQVADAPLAVAVIREAGEDSVDAFGSREAPWRFVARVQGAFNRSGTEGDPIVFAIVAGKTVAVPDFDAEKSSRHTFGRMAREFGIVGVAAWPVHSETGCTGSVIACFTETRRAADLSADRVGTLVAHAGIALRRARRFEALRAESQRSRALIAESAEGICTFDRELRVGLWNKAAERITGIARGEIAGKSLTAAGLRARSPAHPRAFSSFEDTAEVFVGNPGRAVEVSLSPSSREPVWISLAGALTGAGGRRQNLVCCFRDITEQKRLESMRRDFVSLVTHQLRTPLTAIRGYAELLATIELPADRVREHGAVIAGAAVRLGDAITDVMDFERLATTRDGLRLAPVSLDDALRTALSAVNVPTSHSVRLPDGLGDLVVEADLDRLTRLFAHVFGNAVRYWPDGGVIEVQGARENGFVRCSVIDHGPGIDIAEHAELFSPYHRAAKRHLSAGQGLGLGLSLSKRIAEAHHGRIELAETPGGGATVTVWLPALG